MLQGAITAIVTPFKDGKLDEGAYRELIEFQIKGGINGIVPCGTTGESATLSHPEHKRVTEICIDEVKKRVPVLAGTGSNSTTEAIEMTVHAKKIGADGALMVSPYYNKPTQEGIFRHFKTVAEEAKGLPIVLYNIPGRTGSNILPETIARLSEIDNIVGVKEATGDLNQMARTIELCGPDFTVVSGDDALTLPLLAIGGKGVISVVGQVAPREMTDMYAAWKKGDAEDCRRKFFKLLPLMRSMFMETNPIPVKAALAMMGLIGPEMRLPMCEMGPENLAKLRTVLESYGLVK
jgi:4-hydroxy-tetrahydrodipicolinate synthase